MKVTIKPGTKVRLGNGQTASTRGGTYDISKLAEADQKRILATPGVEPLSGTKKASPKETE